MEPSPVLAAIEGMRNVLTTLCLVAAALPASAAPSADEILSQARKALGNVASLKSLSLTGARRTAIETPDGPNTMNRESEMHFLLPDKFLRAETMELPGGIPGPTLVDALDGDKSWNDTQNAPSGGNLVIMRRGPGPESGPASEEARTRALRSQYLRHVLLLTLTPPPGMDVKFEYTGEAESPDGKVWMIDVSGPDKFALRLFVDQKSKLPVMASWRGLQAAPMIRMMRMGPESGHKPGELPPTERPKPREVEFELRLSEYEKQGGILLPKVMTTSVEGKLTEEFEIKSAKVNPNLKPEKFRK